MISTQFFPSLYMAEFSFHLPVSPVQNRPKDYWDNLSPRRTISLSATPRYFIMTAPTISLIPPLFSLGYS